MNLGDILGGRNSNTISALSQTEMIGGLKEVLAQGTEAATNRLGKTNGFLENNLVKISLPQPKAITPSTINPLAS